MFPLYSRDDWTSALDDGGLGGNPTTFRAAGGAAGAG